MSTLPGVPRATNAPTAGRRLTPLGIRFLLMGLVGSLFATTIGSRPLLLVGIALTLLPLFALATLPGPAGRSCVHPPERMQAGVPSAVRVHYRRSSPRFSAPITVTLIIPGWAPQSAAVGPLASGDLATADFPVVAASRGVIREAGVIAVTRDPLGLATARWTAVRRDLACRVLPMAVASPRVPSRSSGDEPEFAGLRGWQAGDRQRDVDWRATARRPQAVGAGPVVRLWTEAPTRGGEIVVGLVGGPDPVGAERVAELAAALVRQAFGAYEVVTLRWATGELSAQRPEPLLDALAEFPLVGAGSPATCDVLITPVSAVTGEAHRQVWQVDHGGRVAVR